MTKEQTKALIITKVTEFYREYSELFDSRTHEVFPTLQSVKDFMIERASKESSFRHLDNKGNVLTVSGSTARGLYQITKPAESDVIRLSHIEGISALNIDENIFIAFYYIFLVIPEFFSDYDKEFTKSNFVTAYTQGWKKCTDNKSSDSLSVDSDKEDSASGNDHAVVLKSLQKKLLIAFIIITILSVISYTYNQVKKTT